MEATKFVFVLIEANIRQKTLLIFETCSDCDHQNIKIEDIRLFK